MLRSNLQGMDIANLNYSGRSMLSRRGPVDFDLPQGVGWKKMKPILRKSSAEKI
jgi:hypothetical protein